MFETVSLILRQEFIVRNYVYAAMKDLYGVVVCGDHYSVDGVGNGGIEVYVRFFLIFNKDISL